MICYSQSALWDHATVRINPGKDSQIYLAQFSPFHLNKLNDLSDLLNITHLDLKLKWNSVNSLPESSNKICVAISAINNKMFEMKVGHWASLHTILFMPSNKINLCKIIVLL